MRGLHHNRGIATAWTAADRPLSAHNAKDQERDSTSTRKTGNDKLIGSEHSTSVKALMSRGPYGLTVCPQRLNIRCCLPALGACYELDATAMLNCCAIIVRKFETAESSAYRSLRLSALEESPDAFGSTLGAEQLRTAEEWASRLQIGCDSGLDLPLIAQVGTTAAGLAWGKVDRSDNTIVHLYQMWVAPEFRGRGVARLLLRTIVAWAASLQARSVHLGVVCRESSAMRLYASEGFVPFGQVEPLRHGSELLTQSMRFQISNAAV